MVKRKSVWHKNIEKARKLMGKYSKKESEASVYINCSFNNTIITITNKQGNTLFWSSGGTAGLKGSRRSTAHAAKKAAKPAPEKVAKPAAEAKLEKSSAKKGSSEKDKKSSPKDEDSSMVEEKVERHDCDVRCRPEPLRKP